MNRSHTPCGPVWSCLFKNPWNPILTQHFCRGQFRVIVFLHVGVSEFCFARSGFFLHKTHNMLILCLGGSFVSACQFRHYKWIEVTSPVVLSGLFFSKILETQFRRNIFAEASFKLLFFYMLVFLNFVLQDQVSSCTRPTVNKPLQLAGVFLVAVIITFSSTN